ncbi:hypothetical protein ACS59P_000076 [Escherichia coli]
MWWSCVTLSLCATKVTHWSGAVRERSRILVQFTVTRQQSLAAMQAAARKVKGADVAAGAGLPERFRRSAILARDLAQIKSADNQQVQTNREIVRIPVGWKHSQQTGAVKGCIVYNSQPLPQ